MSEMSFGCLDKWDDVWNCITFQVVKSGGNGSRPTMLKNSTYYKGNSMQYAWCDIDICFPFIFYQKMKISPFTISCLKVMAQRAIKQLLPYFSPFLSSLFFGWGKRMKCRHMLCTELPINYTPWKSIAKHQNYKTWTRMVSTNMDCPKINNTFLYDTIIDKITSPSLYNSF